MSTQQQSRRKALCNLAGASILLAQEATRSDAAESKSVIRPEDEGAVGDGVHDDTKALQAAINRAAGRTILLTRKTYKVGGDKAGVLNIPASGMRLRGQGDQRPVITCTTEDAYILKGNAVRNVEISHISFEGTDGRTIGVGVHGASSNIRISDCIARTCGLYHGTTSADGYAGASKTNSPARVAIRNCVGTGDPTGVAGNAFISLYYHSDTDIRDCRAENYKHGIMWWGGNSAANADGKPDAERKASDIAITNCDISNMGAGGIWGSMGRNIQVSNCTVDTCGDVGFDAEGCQEVIFRGGKVRNCANGCLTTFWGARNIIFRDIDVELSGDHKLAFRSYNATLQATFAESVRIIGGRITCMDGIGWLDQANGPLDNFSMQGTRLKNVIVQMTQQNIHNVVIDGVTLEITLRAPEKSGEAAISIGHLQQDGRGHGSGIVRNCQITTSEAQPGLDNCAVEFIGGDVNGPTSFLAEGNKISGFGTAFRVSDSAGLSNYRLVNNSLGSGAIDRIRLSRGSTLTSN